MNNTMTGDLLLVSRKGGVTDGYTDQTAFPFRQFTPTPNRSHLAAPRSSARKKRIGEPTYDPANTSPPTESAKISGCAA
jgi:hypothetical protein